MRGQRGVWIVLVVLFGGAVGRLYAEDIGCVSTTFRVLGANDKICVSAFDDPKVSGVTCHLSQARTGGVKGTVGVAEDRSRSRLISRSCPKRPRCLASGHRFSSKRHGSCGWSIWRTGRWCIWRIAHGWSRGPPSIASPQFR
jgi:catabolite regulation protein CreA